LFLKRKRNDMTGQSRRRVLITGASRGVGAGIAKAFASAGDLVVLAARSEDRLKRVQSEIIAGGGAAEVQVADLSTRKACRELARRCDPIDILINNAALTAGSYRSVLEEADNYWDLNFAVSFFAPLILMQEIGRGMVKRGFGVIVNVSSMAAQRAVPQLAPYSVVKSALDALSKAAGMDLAPYGIRVNAIALGHVDTEAFAENCADGLTPQQVAKRNAPLGRLISVEEIGGLCVYLASDSAAPIVGSVVTIDGGLTAGMWSFSGNFSDTGRKD
jgi:NAD(P)-dependent dehydrogenase (short-subunit alcohol dehydrogenase family)